MLNRRIGVVPEPDEAPRRRREDELEDEVSALEVVVKELRTLNRIGSANFRHYRRRAYVAFGLLAIAETLALFMVFDLASDVSKTATTARTELARAGADVAIAGCQADDRTRAGIRTFIVVTAPKLAGRAEKAFPPRDCGVEVAPLLRRIGG